MSDSTQNGSPSEPGKQRTIEQAVLGSVIHDFDYCLSQGFEDLQRDWFTLGGHRYVYEAILKLAKAGTPVDLVNVGMELPSQALEVASLCDKVPSGAGFPGYLSLLRESWAQRQLQEAWSHAHAAFEEGGYEGGKRVLEECFRNTDLGGRDTVRIPLSTAVNESLPQIMPAAERRRPGAVATGVERLDEILGDGLTLGSYTILAARPSMGKSALATQIIYSLGYRMDSSLLFSLEMARTEIAKNMIALESGVNSWAIRRGNYRDGAYEDVLEGAATISDLPIEIVDECGLNVDQIAALVRRRMYSSKLDLVVVDYLQLIAHGKGDNRDERVSAISRTLKDLAKSTGVPFLVIAQLNREVDSQRRKDHRPRLSDLRESGAIEQDADNVLFLYRDGYYKKDVKDEDAESGHSKTELIVAKQRLGPVGTVYLDFNLRCGAFEPWEGEEELPRITTPAMTGNRAVQAMQDKEDLDDPFPDK